MKRTCLPLVFRSRLSLEDCPCQIVLGGLCLVDCNLCSDTNFDSLQIGFCPSSGVGDLDFLGLPPSNQRPTNFVSQQKNDIVFTLKQQGIVYSSNSSIAAILSSKLKTVNRFFLPTPKPVMVFEMGSGLERANVWFGFEHGCLERSLKTGV